MEAITASLERSLQNCSLNNNNNNSHQNEGSATTDAAASGGGGIGISSSSSSSDENHISDTTLDLNSNISLPYHWEQCLDLKTGEIYYINWRNGMKAKEDPRRAEEAERECEESEEEEEEEEEESWYDSEESSSESSTIISKEQYDQREVIEKQNVLVVAGCKSCLMYFMVPKQVEDCPKCSGQLLHFDRSENCSP